MDILGFLREYQMIIMLVLMMGLRAYMVCIGFVCLSVHVAEGDGPNCDCYNWQAWAQAGVLTYVSPFCCCSVLACN